MMLRTPNRMLIRKGVNSSTVVILVYSIRYVHKDSLSLIGTTRRHVHINKFATYTGPNDEMTL